MISTFKHVFCTVVDNLRTVLMYLPYTTSSIKLFNDVQVDLMFLLATRLRYMISLHTTN